MFLFNIGIAFHLFMMCCARGVHIGNAHYVAIDFRNLELAFLKMVCIQMASVEWQKYTYSLCIAPFYHWRVCNVEGQTFYPLLFIFSFLTKGNIWSQIPINSSSIEFLCKAQDFASFSIHTIWLYVNPNDRPDTTHNYSFHPNFIALIIKYARILIDRESEFISPSPSICFPVAAFSMLTSVYPNLVIWANCKW